MTTHLSLEQMQKYLVRRLSVDELATMGEHLHGCEGCYEVYLSVLQTRFPIEIDFDELAGLKGWHLKGKELASYIEGEMNEVDFDYATLHLEECSACERKVQDATRRRGEYERWTESNSKKDGISWREYLRGVYSVLSPRFRLAGAAALLVVLSLLTWAVLQPKAEKSQLEAGQSSETVSPDPSQQRSAETGQPDANPGVDIGHRTDSSKQSLVATDSEKREGRQQGDRIEQELIAKNLTMPPAIEMLDRTPAIAVRGNPSLNPSFTIVRPFATLLENNRPTFRWTKLSGATSYIVSVYDAALNLIRTSEPVTDTQWLIPEPLQPGIVYTWTVTALRDGQEIVAPPPPARAEFKILGKPEMHSVNRALSGITSHAARGVLYAEAGLLDEAEKEFQIHLGLQPTDQRVKKFLEVVESWRVAK